MKKWLLLIFLTFTVSVYCPALFSGTSAQAPETNNTEAEKLIKEGIHLHGQGQYLKAINKYRESLKIKPDNPLAHYEIAYTYFAHGDYNKSLSSALKALEFKSDIKGIIYLQIGTCLDVLGKPEEAIKYYQEGIKTSPNNYLLHFNKGITYWGMKQYKNANTGFKKAAQLKPDHASSHLALATGYLDDEYRIPSLLAYCRFLILEPHSKRTGNALITFQKVLRMDVSKKSDKNITIYVPENTPTYDGDFSAARLALSLTSSTRYLEKNKNTHPIDFVINQLESLFTIIRELNENNNYPGFAWEYYAPYFMEMQKKGHVKAFVYFIFQLAKDEYIKAVIEKNRPAILQFLKWSENYNFKK